MGGDYLLVGRDQLAARLERRLYIGMGRLEAAHQLDDGIEFRVTHHLVGGKQRRRCASALRMCHRDGFQGDRPAGGSRDAIGVLDQPPRQRSADVAQAEQTDSIRDGHSGTLPSPP